MVAFRLTGSFVLDSYIEAACREFQRRLHARENPTVTPFLEPLDGRPKQILLRELIAIQLDPYSTPRCLRSARPVPKLGPTLMHPWVKYDEESNPPPTTASSMASGNLPPTTEQSESSFQKHKYDDSSWAHLKPVDALLSTGNMIYDPGESTLKKPKTEKKKKKENKPDK